MPSPSSRSQPHPHLPHHPPETPRPARLSLGVYLHPPGQYQRTLAHAISFWSPRCRCFKRPGSCYRCMYFHLHIVDPATISILISIDLSDTRRFFKYPDALETLTQAPALREHAPQRERPREITPFFTSFCPKNTGAGLKKYSKDT
jgi:hypothetical protein